MNGISMLDACPLMFGTIGGWEIFMIFLVVLLLFGAKRLPEIARSMGKAINEFKKTKHDLMNDTSPELDDSTPDEKRIEKNEE